MKRPVVFVSAMLLIVLTMMLIGWTVKPAKNKEIKKSVAAAAQSQPPQHVVYNMLFRQIAWMNAEAAKIEREGKNGSVLRNRYRTLAGLSDVEAGLLNVTVEQTNAQVREIETRASAAIDRERARRKAERITTPPVLTPELRALEQERKNAIMAGVASLKAQMGAARFAQFETVVNDQITNKITMMGYPDGSAHFPWMDEKSPSRFDEAKKGGLK